MNSAGTIVSLALLLLTGSLAAQSGQTAELWLTTADRTSLIAKQPGALEFRDAGGGAPAISVDDSKKFQSMDGFGFALTGGSAQLLMKMDSSHRRDLLQQLFGTDGEAIGVSYLRVSIGSSDINDHAFTYDDLAAGSTDTSLAHFDLGPDLSSVIPVLKEILALRPTIKILGSPWSAPAWMKTNGALKGGSLKPEDYKTYAQYLVKYLKSMQAEGIAVDAITPQNEPLNPNNTPSTVMEAADEGAFIAHSLGPALRKAGLKTKIVIYDHNCDRPDYPLTILAGAKARKYVDGSGFHLYGGKITAMTEVHNSYPKKNLYFTEQMVVDKPGSKELAIADPVERLIIAAPRNWSRTVLLWNLAADPEFRPHTDDGGCPVCEGAITIDGNEAIRNLAYYTLAHASKFVPPGSIRIESNLLPTLSDVAFETPNGKIVLIVANGAGADESFDIRYRGKYLSSSLKAGSVGTYVW